jgi:hypothetical protein
MEATLEGEMQNDGGREKYKFERQNGEKHKERWKKMRLKIK